MPTQSLHQIAKSGNVDSLIQHLTALGNDDIDRPDRLGFTPLHVAAAAGHAAAAEQLIIAGASVDATDPHGNTPLHAAAMCGHTDVARLLIVHGADVDAAGGTYRTPLHHAAFKGPEMVATILRGNPDVDMQESKAGETALHIAARKGHAESIGMLLDRGADPNIKDNKGQTPLQLAAALGNAEMAKSLMSRGADPTLRDQLGDTALHAAARTGSTATATAIVDVAGADALSVRNDFGRTAGDSAAGSGHKATAAVLGGGKSVPAVPDDSTKPVSDAEMRAALKAMEPTPEVTAIIAAEPMPAHQPTPAGQERAEPTAQALPVLSDHGMDSVVEAHVAERRKPFMCLNPSIQRAQPTAKAADQPKAQTQLTSDRQAADDWKSIATAIRSGKTAGLAAEQSRQREQAALAAADNSPRSSARAKIHTAHANAIGFALKGDRQQAALALDGVRTQKLGFESSIPSPVRPKPFQQISGPRI